MINKLILEQIKGESGSIKLGQDRLCWYRSQEQSPSCEFKLLCSVRVHLHKKKHLFIPLVFNISTLRRGERGSGRAQRIRLPLFHGQMSTRMWKTIALVRCLLFIQLYGWLRKRLSCEQKSHVLYLLPAASHTGYRREDEAINVF